MPHVNCFKSTHKHLECGTVRSSLGRNASICRGKKEDCSEDTRIEVYAVLQKEFQRMAHFMKFCQALRERQLPIQTTVLGRLGIKKEDILMQQGFAGMLKPSYVLVRDHQAQCIVLAIRGTHSVKVRLTIASTNFLIISGQRLYGGLLSI